MQEPKQAAAPVKLNPPPAVHPSHRGLFEKWWFPRKVPRSRKALMDILRKTWPQADVKCAHWTNAELLAQIVSNEAFCPIFHKLTPEEKRERNARFDDVWARIALVEHFERLMTFPPPKALSLMRTVAASVPVPFDATDDRETILTRVVGELIRKEQAGEPLPSLSLLAAELRNHRAERAIRAGKSNASAHPPAGLKLRRALDRLGDAPIGEEHAIRVDRLSPRKHGVVHAIAELSASNAPAGAKNIASRITYKGNIDKTLYGRHLTPLTKEHFISKGPNGYVLANKGRAYIRQHPA